MRTGVDTGTAVRQALGFPEDQLFFGLDALGIMAPPTVQGTSFKKDSGADAGAVMDGIFFYVKDKALFHPPAFMMFFRLKAFYERYFGI